MNLRNRTLAASANIANPGYCPVPQISCLTGGALAGVMLAAAQSPPCGCRRNSRDAFFLVILKRPCAVMLDPCFVMLNEVKHLREAIWLKGDGIRA